MARMTELEWDETGARSVCEEAIARQASGELLPDDLWAAWIWTLTGISTVPQVYALRSGDEIPVGLARNPCKKAAKWNKKGEMNLDPQPLWWESPATIAAKSSRWSKASGGKMADWVHFLADEMVRKHACVNAGELPEDDRDPDLDVSLQAKRLRCKLFIHTEEEKTPSGTD